MTGAWVGSGPGGAGTVAATGQARRTRTRWMGCRERGACCRPEWAGSLAVARYDPADPLMARTGNWYVGGGFVP